MATETINLSTFLSVTQNGHGFVAGNVLYRTSGGYAKARANAISTSKVVGVVASVPTANTFTIALPGHKINGLSGFTDGAIYYLSETVAGDLQTTIAASPNLAVPVAVAVGTTSLLVGNLLGHLVYDPLTQDRPDHPGGDLTFHFFGGYDTVDQRSERITGFQVKTWLSGEFDTIGAAAAAQAAAIASAASDATTKANAAQAAAISAAASDATTKANAAQAAAIAAAAAGNAATATALQTPRTINGVSFDGTTNIAITEHQTPFLVRATTPFPYNNLPADANFFQDVAPPSVFPVDLTHATQARIYVYTATTGSAGSKLSIKYKTGAWSATAGDYSDIGTSEVAATVSAGNTFTDSGWINLAAGAKAEVYVSVFGLGGNGVADPTFNILGVQFR